MTYLRKTTKNKLDEIYKEDVDLDIFFKFIKKNLFESTRNRQRGERQRW